MDHAHEKSNTSGFQGKTDPYFNALQVKYSYVLVISHRDNGKCFVEQPYLPEGPNNEYFRWLYTVRTRQRTFVFGRF